MLELQLLIPCHWRDWRERHQRPSSKRRMTRRESIFYHQIGEVYVATAKS